MNFEIESKDQEGNVVFKGTATKDEASFLLNVGISYLLASGVMPLLTGNITKEQAETMMSGPDTTGTIQ